MEKVYIGEIIREQRIALGLSQEDLCEGICDPSTISRLENGRSAPSRTKIDGLLQRLGLPDDRYMVVQSKNELLLDDLKKEAQTLAVRFQQAADQDKPQLQAQVMEALDRLEKNAEADDLMTRQYVASQRVLLKLNKADASPARQAELLIDALRLTAPKFDPQQIGHCRYTMNETRLITQIAVAYAASGNHQLSIDIYRQLLRYMQENIRQMPRYIGQLAMVAFNYALELDLTEQYEEALQVAEQGKTACIQHGHYQFLPGLLHIMAECQHYLGNDAESRELYMEAFYIYKVVGDTHNLERLKKDAQEQVDWTPQ